MTQDRKYRRKPIMPDDFAFSYVAIRWMEQLPEHVCPVELALKFPRIINTIAAKQADAVACQRYLHSLLFDDRGGRAGFSFQIVQEINILRRYFESLSPPTEDVWMKAIDTDQR